MADFYFQLKDLAVGYHGNPLIRDINIGIDKGEIVTLIGPNGSGKSTILKSITRQLKLIGGTVFFDDTSLMELSYKELSSKMAVVLTERIKTELMNCHDIVATGRYPYTGRLGILTKRDEELVEEAMEAVHAQELGNQDFNAISDGQRQRVLLARAICQEPEIILLDEPTSYLDIRYKLEFLSILQEMKRKKKLTVIMSLHELDLAERISDKVLCINGMAAERFGRPEEIFTPGYLSRLFSVSAGSYDEANGDPELPKAEGTPQFFVIAGGGSGRAVYRRLQRRGIPFAAGILFRNDLDYPTAKALAVQVAAAESFEPITAELVEEAKKQIDVCRAIICCREQFGTFEQANQELLAYAKKHGKEIIYEV